MIWRLTYCNKEGVEARIDIIKGNRTPIEIVQGSGQPFTLAYKLDKTDKSGHIMTSSADIEIFETETFNIDDLKTSNETELKVEYFEDNVLTWSGFILPDFFSREIGSPNIVRMTASDRLTALKGVTLSDLPSRISLRNLIELSLSQTGLNLGLVSQIQINQGSTNILDSEILSQRLIDVRGRSISCYDILMSIMVGTNSTIRQRAGQWQVYNKLEHELRTPTIFFDKVERGAIRTIQPVASSVGVYQEHGGGRIHPENYDFSDNLAGWNPVGGFNGSINNKEILGYYQTYNIIYGEETDKSYLVNSNNFTTSRYIETDAFAVPYEEGKIIVKAEINATGPRVQRGLGAAKIRFALIAEKNGALLSLNDSGAFVAGEHIQEREFSTGSPLDLIAVTMNIEVSGVLMSPAGYSVRLRFYGSNVGVDGDVTRVTAIDSAIVSFDPEAGTPKGNIYKTTQGSNFTKLHDVETTVFGDYITTGLNGYFYKYPIDDTSNLYLPSGELSPPQWITAFDLTERPLLHHISRQKSSLFSVAHDILKANINVESFDPLAVFQDCKGGKYVVVSARFDFLRSEVNVELEQIAYDNTILKRDYIYSYFGDGEDTIKSIGGIAGGGGGTGGSGGMTSDQVAMLNDVAKLAHLHENKEVIDQITQDMVDNASHEIVISTDTETELTDENILSALRVLGEITKNNETFLEDLKERFLSKIEPDTAQKLITFIEGVEVGDFTTGALGGGAALKMIDGTSYAEVDNLTVRQKATFRELIIESLKHIGGQLVLTPARMKCVRVVEEDTFYKCYFDTGDGEVSNEFVEGDLARCQVFTGNGTKFYWRLVTLVGEDWINLSKTSAAVGSDAPEAGDDIAQLGNATDTERQSAIILSTVGIDAPSWKQYSGINSFSLEGKETTVFSKLGNRISGETVFTSGGANLEDHLDGVAQDILDALQAAQDADDKAQQAIEDAEADVAIINTEIGRLQDQIDGKVSNWYYAYSPTLSNYPASDWTTNEIKDSHIGDTFTNTEPAPAENAGKSWRFIKDGSTYSWIVISDSDALKALQEASKAQATADGKSTTYLFQPTKYKLGDMWVLNDDHTINGTAYKQGDLLTATQDSETFVQSHWLKRVRYTDDTAVDNLEIGGRNYVRKSILTDFRRYLSSQMSYEWVDFEEAPNTDSIRIKGSAGDSITVGWMHLTSLRLSVGDIVSAKYTIKNNATTPINISSRLKVGNINFTLQPGEVYYFKDEGFPLKKDRIQFGLQDIGDELDVSLGGFVINKGNKATDWTPAPEDVEASIETAKTEAENASKAYADTKAEAERVLAEAYADGIVTAEEQARIDDVNDKLAAAKAYADAQDALLKTQQEAYADGKISTAEQAAIDAAKAYADLKKTEAEAYADGKVSAEEARAIADATAKFNDAKAHAEQLVKDIEIGGRNLISGTSNEYVSFESTEYNTLIYRIETESALDVFDGGTFTTSATFEEIIEDGLSGVSLGVSFRNKNGGAIAQYFGDVLNVGYSGKNVFTYTFPKRPYERGDYIEVHIRNRASGGLIKGSLRGMKFEKGNKATDWTPAPEDVQADIETAKTEAENAAQAYADTKAEAERVLAEAYADGIVSDEEQARIDDVNDKLAAAKAYAEAQDALLKTQQEAYADGKISTAEQAAINAAKDYADLKKTEAQAYADGIVSDEEARAIADALAKFNESKAHAETLVNNIEIGGRNLLEGTTNYPSNFNFEGYNGTSFRVSQNKLEELSQGGSYTVSGYFEEVSATVGAVTLMLSFRNSNGGVVLQLSPGTSSSLRDGESGRIIYTFDVPNLTSSNVAYAEVHLRNNTPSSSNSGIFKEIQLEKGTKPTDWTPAPEDVQAEIDAEKTRINDILSDNVADPSEKQYLSNLWQEIYAEYPRIWAQANAYSVNKTTYEQKYTALKNILDPVLANLTINSTVSGSSIRTAFSQYYDARTVLQNAITNKVNQNAVDADAKAQALDYLKLAIGQDTEINGALVTLVTMLLKQDMNADVTAGISGLQGAAKNLPAFWAGGTDVQAQQGTAKAIIRHDGTSKFTDAEITGVINALSGEIGNLSIQDGELKSSYSKSKAIWDYSKFPAEYVGERTVSGEVTVSVDAVELNEAYTYQGIRSTKNTRITPDGVSVKSTSGAFIETKSELVDGRLSIEVSNTSTGYSSKAEIFSDGIYFDGQKFTGGEGGSDYVHPSTHTASMITAGTLQGIVKANNNTSYTTKQVRNMILSTGDAISSQMANGDIWIKYE